MNIELITKSELQKLAAEADALCGARKTGHVFQNTNVDDYIQYVREHLAACEKALQQGLAAKAKEQLGQAIEWSKAAIRALPNR